MRYCPHTKNTTLYLDCLECEDKICRKGEKVLNINDYQTTKPITLEQALHRLTLERCNNPNIDPKLKEAFLATLPKAEIIEFLPKKKD